MIQKPQFIRGALVAYSFAALAACASTQSSTRLPSSAHNDGFEVALHDAAKTDYKVGNLKTVKYTLETAGDRAEFAAVIESRLQKKDKRENDDSKVALEEISARMKSLASPKISEADRAARIYEVRELVEAYNSNYMSPVPPSLWLGAVPYELLKMLHHSIMSAQAPVANDLGPFKDGTDTSLVDPVASSFWQPVRNIEKLNLYYGFDRTELPNLKICDYQEPKKSYGVHGGFKVTCDGKKWKIKFAEETKTEPFTSRLVWALGYNATPIDYMPAGVKVKYDRKLITEFNSRKNLKTAVKSALGFTYISLDQQSAINPFGYAIASLELNDGTIVPAAEAQGKLLKAVPTHKNKENWFFVKDAKFNASYEKKVRYFVLAEGSVEGPREGQVDVGSWSWRRLDHPDRRETRAFGLIAAWVNLFDARQNNNRLSLEQDSNGETHFVHAVSDLGSGFGEAKDLFHYHNGMFNTYPWDIVRLRTQDEEQDSDDEASEPYRSPYEFLHYSIIEKNESFRNMQLEDAQWIARRFGRLSEAQIADMFVAAGLTASEAQLTNEKFLSRRQQILDVMGLGKEFPRIMKRKFNREMNFDPSKDQALEAKGARSPRKARVTRQTIVNGVLLNEKLEPEL